MPDQTDMPDPATAAADLGKRPAAKLDDPTGAITVSDADGVPTRDESEDFGDPRASLAAREDADAAADDSTAG